MSETVHILLLGEDESIDSIVGVYSDKERAKQAAETIEKREQWGSGDQWIDCESAPVNRGSPY